jgi:hypothetical protein
MKELDLDKLLKEKREEPSTVSISAVNSWLKGGVIFVGLFASLKWLFTKKMWLMLTSITSISIATIVAIVHLNSSVPNSEKTIRKKTQEHKMVRAEFKQKIIAPNKQLNSKVVDKIVMNEVVKLNKLSPVPLFIEHEMNSIEPLKSNRQIGIKNNQAKDQFKRIDANGFVHFTLVKGTSYSIQNTIADEDGEPLLEYSIKNGTLYLNSANDNNASDLIITVVDLVEIKLNGFCEIVTNSTYQSNDLEIEANGCVNMNIDLNVNNLEIEMNGETKGILNLKSNNFEFESNGFNDVQIECDCEESRIEVTGFSKIKFIGTSTVTMMDINGESKISAEEFASRELYLKMSGFNKKLETEVSSNLEAEISGENTVVITGSPEIINKEVSKGSKLKIK